MDYESNLISYFENLSIFNYNQAKIKIKFTFIHENGSLLFEWLNYFINLEKNYYSFIFITFKYSGLLGRKKQSENYTELKRQINNYRNGRKATQLLDDVANYLIFICDYRSEIIEFYRSLQSLKSEHFFKISDELPNLIEIINKLKKDADNEIFKVLNPLLAVIRLELNILKSILEAHERTTNLYFLEPLNELQSAQSLVEDLEKLQLQSGAIDPPSTNVISWLKKMVAFVIEKYTLYFQPVLMRYATLHKDISPSPDSFMFEKKIKLFVSRQCPCIVSILFDTTQQSHSFISHGYVLPTTKGQPLIGLQNFQTIFSTSSSSLGQQELFLVVSLIRDKITPCTSRRIVHLFHNNSSHKPSTLFVCKIEPRVYLVVIFESQKNENDKLVNSFMTEFSQQLQGLNLLEQMKIE